MISGFSSSSHPLSSPLNKITSEKSSWKGKLVVVLGNVVVSVLAVVVVLMVVVLAGVVVVEVSVAVVVVLTGVVVAVAVVVVVVLAGVVVVDWQSLMSGVAGPLHLSQCLPCEEYRKHV